MTDLFEAAPNLAIFCDFENVAIGARDAKYNDFDIHLVLERLLDKGKIVVKRAYADWSKFQSAKKPMHQTAFEMIEIPHVSYSGKNSADIRMVVDALDLCYTKKHIDLFVVITGDSDFSPLVSKLRENNKLVIGVGVKAATSGLLIENCDEYIFYDDLVRAQRKEDKRKSNRPRRDSKPSKPSTGSNGASKSAAPEAPRAEVDSSAAADETGSKEEALELVLETVEALFLDRDENIFGSLVKQTIKRKKPQFSESFYGFRSFNDLLEGARDLGYLEISKDERSGGYIIVGFGENA